MTVKLWRHRLEILNLLPHKIWNQKREIWYQQVEHLQLLINWNTFRFFMWYRNVKQHHKPVLWWSNVIEYHFGFMFRRDTAGGEVIVISVIIAAVGRYARRQNGSKCGGSFHKLNYKTNLERRMGQTENTYKKFVADNGKTNLSMKCFFPGFSECLLYVPTPSTDLPPATPRRSTWRTAASASATLASSSAPSTTSWRARRRRTSKLVSGSAETA